MSCMLCDAGGIATFRDPEMGLWTSKIGLAWFGTLSDRQLC
jgi:hypothetical protein